MAEKAPELPSRPAAQGEQSKTTENQQEQQHLPPPGPPPGYDARQLPPGWIKEFDPSTNRHFYVDTLAAPPRAIWVHPFDDPDFLALHDQNDHHDEERPAYSDDGHHTAPSDVKRPIEDHKDEKHHDKEQHPNARPTSVAGSSSSAGKGKGKERGFFGKLKDKAIGTKEEREAAARQREARRREEERQYIARREAMIAQREAMMREQMAYHNQGGSYYGGPQGGYGPPMQNAYGGPQYQGNYQYGNSPYGQNAYVVQQPARRSGGGGGALPVLGALAGGLLLGDILF